MTEENKLTLHLVVTSLCDRNCYYCCNKEYDIHNLEYVTDDDLKKCDLLCLTGGEPFIREDLPTADCPVKTENLPLIISFNGCISLAYLPNINIQDLISRYYHGRKM